MINMEFFYKLSKKEKIGLMAAIVVIALMLIDRLVISPIGNRIQRIDQEIKFSEKKLSRDLRNMNNKDIIEREYKKYKNYVKKSSVSDEEDVANILGEIEGLARSSSVSLVDIKPQAPKRADFYKEYAIEVEVEGSMEQVITFLHDLNSSAQLLRAVKLRIGLKDKELSAIKASLLVTKISI
ncbi:MAG: type 4a pilus biogenesis protein PilO [Candidatus Omnitrophica bacterium]|nr:type 4a pilus biogenesis protein PilO [Candidatus Omnitrophota bacterium]